jgi:hypothetical protein
MEDNFDASKDDFDTYSQASQVVEDEIKGMVNEKIKMRKKVQYNLEHFANTPVDELNPFTSQLKRKSTVNTKPIYVLSENQRKRWNDLM